MISCEADLHAHVLCWHGCVCLHLPMYEHKKSCEAVQMGVLGKMSPSTGDLGLHKSLAVTSGIILTASLHVNCILAEQSCRAAQLDGLLL